MSKKYLDPIRRESAHSDAFIGNIQKTIENEYKLPRGSVKLVYPNGRKAYSNSTVDALRRRWEQ